MALPQFGAPGSTVAIGNYTLTGATTAHEALDDGYPSDEATTRVNSPADPVNEVIKLGTFGLTDPATGKGHRLRVMASKNAAAPVVDITIEVREGATLRGGTTITMEAVAAYRWYDYLLTEAEANAITNYANIEVWVTVNKVSGASVAVGISAIDLEVPGDALGRTYPEPSVEPKLVSWWIADSLEGVVADAGAIASWQDEYGGGRSVRQATVAERPTFRASVAAIQGLSAVEFRSDSSTTSQGLRAQWRALAPPFTYVAHLVKRVSTGADDNYSIIDADLHAWPYSNDGLNVLLFSGTEGTTPPNWGLNHVNGGAHIFGGSPVNDTEFVVAGEFNASAVNDRLLEDGTEVATGDVGGDNSRGARIGQHRDVTLERCGNYDLHCLHLFNSTLTATEMSDLTTALQTEGSTGVTVTPATIGATAALPASSIQAGANVGPTSIAAIASLPQAALSAGASLSPSTIAALAALPTPTIDTAGAATTVTPSAIASLVAIPTPVIASFFVPFGTTGKSKASLISGRTSGKLAGTGKSPYGI